MSQQVAGECPRKEYETPIVRTIDLAMDEVMAVGCKLTGGGSANSDPFSCNVTTCATAGS